MQTDIDGIGICHPRLFSFWIMIKMILLAMLVNEKDFHNLLVYGLHY